MVSPLFWEEKLVRDPLYGFVGLTHREDEILDTIPLQRLARIKQLAHAYIVFPSAVHTRLEHSLGTLYVADRMCEQLEIDGADREAIRAAALLHDIGHGPYSHLFEDILRFVNGEKYGHEDVTRLIVENDKSIRKALAKLEKRVIEILDGDSLASDIVSSSLDADKMDYLRRDSYHTGVAYGVFDIERVLRSIGKVKEIDVEHIAIKEKGMDALESYRLGRYSMHAQVYEHHTRLVADDMFVRAVLGALVETSLPWDYVDAKGQETFLKRYMEMDDNSIENFILSESKGIPRQLIQDIRSRRLLKRAYMISLTKEGVPNALRRDWIMNLERPEISSMEKKIAEEIGIEPEYVIIHLQSIKIKLYERFEQAKLMKEKPIIILKRDGTPRYMDEESPIFISESMNPIRRLIVFCPESKITRVKEIAEGIFHTKSAY